MPGRIISLSDAERQKLVEAHQARKKLKWREKTAKRRTDRVAKGLCTYCGSEREDKDYQLCTKCRSKKRDVDADYMSRGLCRNCGGSREDSTVQHCDRCREAQRTTGLKKKYDITVDDYNRMFKEQNGVCWICEKTETTNGGVLHIDHDEQSGAVRGLLCGNCNRGIGCLKHSTKLLTRAIEYLKATKET